MRKINQIIFHCSDSADSRTTVDMLEIDRWHKARGFCSPSGIHCGYHFVILKSGKIEKGRPEEEIGAHAEGHNAHSLGICWVGAHDFNPNQRTATYFLMQSLLAKYGLTEKNVIGHYEVNEYKTCPNVEMKPFRENLEFFIKQHQGV